MQVKHALVCCILTLCSRAGVAQTSFYNLDAGRPMRVDDATPTERYALEILLAPLRMESYANGLKRYRIEPKLSFGALPRTELELRVPVLRVQSRDSGSVPLTGVASIGLGATHAISLEGSRMPGMAIGGEYLFPVGQLSAPKASYALKAMFTKTFSLFRVHVNAGGGTYSVQPTSSAIGCVAGPRRLVLGKSSVVPCTDTTQRFVPGDVPCDETPEEHRAMVLASSAVSPATTPADSTLTRGVGPRTLVGLGFDHTFARQSTVVMADITTERFFYLYPTADLTLEIGARHQLSPWLVLDAGFSRKLRGVAQYAAFTFGATYERSLASMIFHAP